MDRDRDRDRRFNDRDSSRFEGDTYRPGDRSNDRPSRPPRELFRDRAPASTGAVDSYVPGRRDRSPPRADTWRRRSRSPRGDDRYRGEYRDRSRERPRSPPRRNFSPPRGIDRYRAPSPRRARSPPPRARTPPRDSRYTPRRDRSPFPAKRSRDVSPIDRRERSPPPKRERLASPVIRSRNFSPPSRRGYSPAPRERDNFRQRSPSPPRRDVRDNRDNFRQRSPSPRRDSRDTRPTYNRRSPSPLRHSGPASGATSRRSSPPIHTSRLRQAPLDERSPRAPPMDTSYGNDSRSPYTSPPREPRERERERGYPATNGAPPTGPRNANLRAPPTGPAGARNFTSPGNYASAAMSPPTGPAASVTPISAHSRAPPVAPSGPRGAFGGRGGFRGGFGGRGGFEGGRGGFAGGRGGFASSPDDSAFRQQQEYPARRTSEVYNNPRAASFSAGVPNAPSGPRASTGGPPTGPAGFRGGPVSQGPAQNVNGSGSSATYPRSQRFLTDLPALVPGGRKIPVKAPPNAAKVKRLEEDAERLRRVIEEKERIKRAGLREWDRLEGESEGAKLRTELAEEGLRKVEVQGL